MSTNDQLIRTDQQARALTQSKIPRQILDFIEPRLGHPAAEVEKEVRNLALSKARARIALGLPVPAWLPKERQNAFLDAVLNKAQDLPGTSGDPYAYISDFLADLEDAAGPARARLAELERVIADLIGKLNEEQRRENNWFAANLRPLHLNRAIRRLIAGKLGLAAGEFVTMFTAIAGASDAFADGSASGVIGAAAMSAVFTAGSAGVAFLLGRLATRFSPARWVYGVGLGALGFGTLTTAVAGAVVRSQSAVTVDGLGVQWVTVELGAQVFLAGLVSLVGVIIFAYLEAERGRLTKAWEAAEQMAASFAAEKGRLSGALAVAEKAKAEAEDLATRPARARADFGQAVQSAVRRLRDLDDTAKVYVAEVMAWFRQHAGMSASEREDAVARVYRLVEKHDENRDPDVEE